MVALKLVDEKNVVRPELVQPIVNEELLPAGYAEINLVCIMDMDVHGFFVVVKMRHGKRPRIQTIRNRVLTRIINHHPPPLSPA